MYKKYVHPCYDWHNLYLKELGNKTFVTDAGVIYSVGAINSKIIEDKNAVTSGDIEPKADQYGLLEINEAEFNSKVIETISDLKKKIVDCECSIEGIKSLTGVYL